MEENNQFSGQNNENNEAQNLQGGQNNAQQAHSALEIDKEIEAVANLAKNKRDFFGVKMWLALLCLVFSSAMLSGIYLSVTMPAKAAKTAELKLEDAEAASSGILGLASKKEGAAVIKINGVIQESGEGGGFRAKQNPSAIAKRIRSAADKKEIKALLLDINSPGGTVASVQDIYDAILYFKAQNKPVVALFRDVSASGGFYIAMAADKIVAQPGTLTGSIGVIMQGGNVTGLLEKIGITVNPIKSGKHKDIGSAYRPMTEEEHALLQELINDTYLQFFNVVKKGRPNIPEEMLKVYADGRIFTGEKAKALGLIDELGGEEKAKEVLQQLTGDKNLKLLTPRPTNVFEVLSFAGMESKLGLNKIEEIATPKISYLWTLSGI